VYGPQVQTIEYALNEKTIDGTKEIEILKGKQRYF
jgi:hypothetical protein